MKMNKKQFLIVCLAPLQPFFSVSEGFKRAKLLHHIKTAFKSDWEFTKKLYKDNA